MNKKMIDITLLLSFLLYVKNSKIVSFKFGNSERFSPFMCDFFVNERCDHGYYTIQNTFNHYSVFINRYVTKIPENIVSDQKYPFTFEENFIGYKYKTDFQMDGCLVKGYTSYVLNDIDYFSDNVGISLAYHFEDESFSIVHLMYKHKHIEHLSFAFQDFGPYAMTHLGGIPTKDYLNKTYQGIFPIDESLHTWGFTLNKIIFKDKEYEINMPTMIHTGLRGSFFSNGLFEFMKNTLLKEEFEKESCKIGDGRFKGKAIFCNEESRKIEFVFGKTKLVLDTQKDLFTNSHFCDNPYPYYNFTGLFLGIFLLKKYEYSVFDYEKKQVELYSDTMVIEMVNNKRVIQNLLCYLSLEMILGLIMYITLFVFGQLRIKCQCKLIASI